MKLVSSAALIAVITLTTGTANAATKLTVLIDNLDLTVKSFDALTKAYSAAHPGITFSIEQRAGGSEGDNIVKTRLATGEMADVFNYNSGSLFQQLHPTHTLADLSGIQGNVIDSFKPAVTSSDGKVRGVPFGPAMGGGIYYNIPIYKKLGLSVPKTWDQFIANSEKIKAAGITPIAQTFGDTWTSQILVLADYYNLQTADPNFAKEYTDNKAKYATTPAALAGFKHQAEIYKKGFLNADFGAAKLSDGMRMVATGAVAQYPMLTFALSSVTQNEPNKVKDIGFFAEPGTDAAKNGLTVWMPAALYVPANSKHRKAAEAFLKFVASPAGCKIMEQATGATGPYLIKNCPLPKDVPPSVADMMPYFKKKGGTAPALEFLSPVKGPNLEQITVAVGSGQYTPEKGAKLYDEDVKKEARQLGLPNW